MTFFGQPGQGKLPPPRPDQGEQRAAQRGTAPGARLQRVQIVNFPGQAVVVQDGGIPGAQSAVQLATSASVQTLVAAGANPAGLKLWSASISSDAAGTPGAQWQAQDIISDTAGNTYLACMISQGNVAGQAENSVSIGLHGIQVPAGKALQLVNGGSGGTPVLRQCSATVVYTVL